jgi:hypothetical protein
MWAKASARMPDRGAGRAIANLDDFHQRGVAAMACPLRVPGPFPRRAVDAHDHPRRMRYFCRVKMRDQQRLGRGPLTEYSHFGEGIPFLDAVPRSADDSAGAQPNRVLKCKVWETDPNAYVYFILQTRGIGQSLQGYRQGRLDIHPALCEALQPTHSRRNFQHNRSVDGRLYQVRANGHPERAGHPLRPHPFDERTSR